MVKLGVQGHVDVKINDKNGKNQLYLPKMYEPVKSVTKKVFGNNPLHIPDRINLSENPYEIIYDIKTNISGSNPEDYIQKLDDIQGYWIEVGGDDEGGGSLNPVISISKQNSIPYDKLQQKFDSAKFQNVPKCDMELVKIIMVQPLED